MLTLLHFEISCNSMLHACSHCIDEEGPYTFGCDPFDFAIDSGCLKSKKKTSCLYCQNKRSECRYPVIEKGNTAIIEDVRKWSYYLCCRKFAAISDQQSLAFMFDKKTP